MENRSSKPTSPDAPHIRERFRRALRTTRNAAVVKDREPKTLCGAPVTDRDVAYHWVIRVGKFMRGRDEDKCPDCVRAARAALEEQE